MSAPEYRTFVSLLWLPTGSPPLTNRDFPDTSSRPGEAFAWGPPLSEVTGSSNPFFEHRPSSRPRGTGWGTLGGAQ